MDFGFDHTHISQRRGSGLEGLAPLPPCGQLTRCTSAVAELLVSFVADPVTIHTHEYVHLSILRGPASTFSVNLAIIVRNVTSQQITMCNCKIRTYSLAFSLFRILEVISEEIRTLINRTMLNKHKIRRKKNQALLSYQLSHFRCWVIFGRSL